ncbi:MAG: DUF1343 domain-containing protein [candidate division KSB1 bacterium]|nr:DUF1343 domain-containing protein [candidate division KSB1 bacterium]
MVSIINAYSVRAQVKPGIDVLIERHFDLLQGRQVGLITNPTGVTADLRSTIDVLKNAPGVRLVALFGPEHGVRGNIMAGKRVASYVDKKTGLPVYSLYGRVRKPTSEMLKNIDMLVYDIQDIGNRTYTYIYTMALAMQAAAEKGIPFVVLDRPNPLGGELIEGPVLEENFKSFIGLYPIPYIYGMTVGELARFINNEFGIHCDLSVVPMRGYRRDMRWPDTGLQWVATSPHIPHAKTALYCATTGIIGELQTVSEGVGYTQPFQLIGQKWIDPERLAAELNRRNLPGVYFRPCYFRPYYFRFQNRGAEAAFKLHSASGQFFSPHAQLPDVHLLHSVLLTLYQRHNIFRTPLRATVFGSRSWAPTVRLAPGLAGQHPDAIMRSWEADLRWFMQKRRKYLIYWRKTIDGE